MMSDPRTFHVEDLIERWVRPKTFDPSLPQTTLPSERALNQGYTLFKYQRESLRACIHLEQTRQVSIDPLLEVRCTNDACLLFSQHDAFEASVEAWQLRSRAREQVAQFTSDAERTRCPACQSEEALTVWRSDNHSVLLADVVRFEAERSGGVVAEAMGTGKTVLAICLILSSLGERPQPPPLLEYAPLSSPGASSNPPPLKKLAARSFVQNFDHSRIVCSLCFPRARSCEHVPEGLLDLLKSEPVPEFLISPRQGNPLMAASSFEDVSYSPRRCGQRLTQAVAVSHGTLIILPPNLVEQWRSEIEKFVKDGILRTLVITHEKDIRTPHELCAFDIVLCSVTVLRTSLNMSGTDPTKPVNVSRLWASPLRKILFRRVVVDEGHVMSHESLQTRICSHLLSDSVWVCTGTPTPNTTLEQELGYLYGLLAFFRYPISKHDWHQLVEVPLLLSQSGVNGDKTALHVSGVILRDALTRLFVRTPEAMIREEVALPALQTKTKRLTFESVEALRYNQFVASIVTNFATSRFEGNDFLLDRRNSKLQSLALMRLRDSCFGHDGLNGDDRSVAIDAILDEFNSRSIERLSKPMLRPDQYELLLSALDMLSLPVPKSDLEGFPIGAKLGYLVSRIQSFPPGTKSLVFTASDDTLRRCLNYFDKHPMTVTNEKTGSTSVVKVFEYHRAVSLHVRRDAVERFQTSPETCVLLMSTTLASLGINLTAASRVFFIEPVLDRAVELQAIARAHRIGNSSPTVYVETLMINETIEESVLTLREARNESDSSKSAQERRSIKQLLSDVRLVNCDTEDVFAHISATFARLALSTTNPMSLRGLLSERLVDVRRSQQVNDRFFLEHDCAKGGIPKHIAIFKERIFAECSTVGKILRTLDERCIALNEIEDQKCEAIDQSKEVALLPLKPLKKRARIS